MFDEIGINLITNLNKMFERQYRVIFHTFSYKGICQGDKNDFTNSHFYARNLSVRRNTNAYLKKVGSVSLFALDLTF